MASLPEKRMHMFAKAIKDFYLSNPDSAAYNKTYIDMLAACMARKVVYGVKYAPDVEAALTRLNYGAGRRTMS